MFHVACRRTKNFTHKRTDGIILALAAIIYVLLEWHYNSLFFKDFYGVTFSAKTPYE